MIKVRLGAALFLVSLAVPAQTIQQAESYWKQRDFVHANEVFQALAKLHPDNPDYRVRWGRMFLEHGARPLNGEDDVQNASDLFNEALKIKADHAGAELGLALIAADEFGSQKADKLARQALEWDPKLLEAQELLAKLALEDNNNQKATTEAKKALEIDPNSSVGKGVLAVIDYLNGKAESQWDPHDARGYETIAHFFVLNRRYEEGIQYYRKAIQLDPTLYTAHAALGLNLMRLSQNADAHQELETAFRNGIQNSATKNTLDLMEKYKNFVEIKSGLTVLKLSKSEADLLKPYFQAEIDRCIKTYEDEIPHQVDQARDSRGLPQSSRLRSPHHGHARTRCLRRHLHGAQHWRSDRHG